MADFAERARDPSMNYVDAMDIYTLEWTEDHVVRYIDLKPFHLNASGIVHGGVILALMDSASGKSGIYQPHGGTRRYSVTVSLTCNFVGPGRQGRLIATGRKLRAGRSMYFTSVEVRDEQGGLVATGKGVHRYRGGPAAQGTASGG